MSYLEKKAENDLKMYQSIGETVQGSIMSLTNNQAGFITPEKYNR